MIFRQEDGIILLRQAGYGDPILETSVGPLVLPEG